MSYDQWLQNAPDPGAGGTRSLACEFWRGYDLAVRWGTVSEYLHIYRSVAAFADLVREAEKRHSHAR